MLNLIGADVTDGYVIRLTLEVREDVSDAEVGGEIKTHYTSKVGMRSQPTIQALDDDVADGVRRVQVRFEMPARYDDAVQFCALLHLLTGRAASSMRIDWDGLSNEFWASYGAMPPIARVSERGTLVVDGTAEEANATLQRGLAFLGHPNAYSIGSVDGVPEWSFPAPGAQAHLRFVPEVRDPRRVMAHYIGTMNL